MKNPLYILILLFLTSCTSGVVKIKNEKFGKLKATHQLIVSETKRFPFDSTAATKPPYMQLYTDLSGTKMLTLLNTHNNAIRFYDYDSREYIKEIVYDKEGPNGILRLEGYYIKNPDSIYVYDGRSIGFALTDDKAEVKDRITLRYTNSGEWALYNPQYLLSTVIPFLHHNDSYIITGFAPFSLPAENLENFNFSIYFDKTNNYSYHNKYPKELYGSDYNWDGAYATVVYPAMTPDGKLIHSFPVSHHLYIADLKSDNYHTKVYAGSNVARTIHSIDHEPRQTPRELIIENVLRGDSYGAILYDPYREVYYRYFLKGIATATKDSPLFEKPIIVIIMDKQFNYLGETEIGTEVEWNWRNSFVTKEGLNIEYIDNDDIEEEYLNIKIIALEEIK